MAMLGKMLLAIRYLVLPLDLRPKTRIKIVTKTPLNSGVLYELST